MVKIIDINDGWLYSEDSSSSFNVLSLHFISKIKFSSLHSLKGIFPNDVTLDIINSTKPSDIFYHALKLFVSYKIVQILLRYNNDLVEFFPVNVLWNGDEYTETSFFLIHIMDKVDCIDRELSEYKIDKYVDDDDKTAFMSEINKLVIHPIDESIHKVFFISDISGISLELAVSDDIAQEMISQNCRGCELIDISAYRKL